MLPSDPVYLATKRMKEMRINAVVVVTGNQPLGILTYTFLSSSIFLNIL